MFYRHSAMADGHLGKCKECTKKDVREHRLANIESVREYDRERSRTPKRRAHISRIAKRWKLNNPLGPRAHWTTNNAIRDGRLERKPCEVCGSMKVHAHHPDYAKPLEVRWLCVIHHSQLHHQKP